MGEETENGGALTIGTPFYPHVIPTVIGHELRLGFSNSGLGGMFAATAKILDFSQNSYPQALQEYSLYWDCERGKQCRIEHNEVGFMVLAESVRRTIQDELITMGLIGSDGSRGRVAISNDITATWNLLVKVWRVGWKLLDSHSYSVTVNPERFKAK